MPRGGRCPRRTFAAHPELADRGEARTVLEAGLAGIAVELAHRHRRSHSPQFAFDPDPPVPLARRDGPPAAMRFGLAVVHRGNLEGVFARRAVAGLAIEADVHL